MYKFLTLSILITLSGIAFGQCPLADNPCAVVIQFDPRATDTLNPPDTIKSYLNGNELVQTTHLATYTFFYRRVDGIQWDSVRYIVGAYDAQACSPFNNWVLLAGRTYLFTKCTPVVLPVVLSEYGTKDCNLYWSAESEVNFNYYQVEYLSGNTWENYATVEPNQDKAYSVDLNKDGYYRVTAWDLDGTFETFATVHCEVKVHRKEVVGYYDLLGRILPEQPIGSVYIVRFNDGASELFHRQ